MTVAEYLRRKDALHNTTFVINEQGGFYLVEGTLVPAREFEQQHQLPMALINARGKMQTEVRSDTIDGRTNWLNVD